MDTLLSGYACCRNNMEPDLNQSVANIVNMNAYSLLNMKELHKSDSAD